MADPYLSPQPGSHDQPRPVRHPSYVQPNRPIPVGDAPRSGMGTGLLVALVFVVVAIMAAVFFRPGPPAIDATTPAVEAPAVETAPVEPVADPAADPGAVQPESGTAEPATPPASGTANP